MSKGSISLTRANPALTSNVKLVVDSQYNLYLESYNSNIELSDKKFKKYLINYNSFLSQRIASFYKNLPTDLAFEVRNITQSDNIQIDYNSQFDDLYFSGPRNVEDTRYLEEFQYNTTLKINPTYLPKYFFIFRIDGPGVNALHNINDLTSNNIDNIQTDFIHKFKVCSVFDLSSKTNLGKLWKKNYIDDDQLPTSSMEFIFKKYEFSKWKGYDYYTGGSVEKSFLMDDYLMNQTTHFEFEKFVTDGFKKNGVICSNLTNISFLFNDTNAGIFYQQQGLVTDIRYYETEFPVITDWIRQGLITTSQYIKNYDPTLNSSYYTFNEHVPYRKKWTINRYSGFYIDNLIQLDQLSPYVTVPFNIGTGIVINNNRFEDSLGNSISPIIGIWNNNLPIYLKIGNQHYLIEQQGSDYLLISNTIINGDLDVIVTQSQKSIQLVYENVKFNPNLAIQVDVPIYRTTLKFIDDTYYHNFELSNYLLTSVVVIQIQDQFYTLQQDTRLGETYFYINTDEYLICDSQNLIRKLGFNDVQQYSIQVLNKDTKITYFPIYVLQFTSVADFDVQRTDTKYAKIENDKSNEVSYGRNFINMYNIQDISLPIDLYYERYYNIWLNSDTLNGTTPIYTQLYFNNQPFILPLNSEYGTADLYMFNNQNKLTEIWNVNQSIMKWGILNSINNSSYPYKINNNMDISGQLNYTPSIFDSIPNLRSFNLDYFYSRGKVTDNIINRTLLINTDQLFDYKYYQNANAKIDLFDYYLNIPTTYYSDVNSISQPRIVHDSRIAYFNASDGVNGPIVFFKGLAAYIQYVNTLNPNSEINYEVTPADDLVDYGFSVLFHNRYTSNISLYGKAGIDITLNRIYQNVLINMYVYTDGSYTNLDYINRDLIYQDEYVKFNLGQFLPTDIPTDEITSELKIQDLTLKNIIKILDNTSLLASGFSQGIKYLIVDNIINYGVASINVTIIGTESKIKLNLLQDISFKEGDWIYLQNTGQATLDNQNFQIAEKINNRTIVLLIQGNYITNTILNTMTFTAEKSVLPFRLKIIQPDELKNNQHVNVVISDISSPVTPFNKFSVNSDLVVNINNDGIIPYVYVDDSISRKLQVKYQNQVFSYSDLDRLPVIYRYGGHCDPITNPITLFKQTTLQKYTNTTTQSVYLVETVVIEGLYYIAIHLRENGTELQNNLKIGDIFQLTNSNIPEFQYVTGHIIDISNSAYFNLISTGTSGYKIILSTQFETNPLSSIIYIANPILGAPNVIDYVYNSFTIFNINLYTSINQNVQFAYEYADFATNRGMIISKVYEGLNPLKTSNEIFKTTNRYPMIDEHGVTEINRNLFKGSWDPEFYYKTVNNKYQIKI